MNDWKKCIHKNNSFEVIYDYLKIIHLHFWSPAFIQESQQLVANILKLHEISHLSRFDECDGSCMKFLRPHNISFFCLRTDHMQTKFKSYQSTDDWQAAKAHLQNKTWLFLPHAN